MWVRALPSKSMVSFALQKERSLPVHVLSYISHPMVSSCVTHRIEGINEIHIWNQNLKSINTIGKNTQSIKSTGGKKMLASESRPTSKSEKFVKLLLWLYYRRRIACENNFQASAINEWVNLGSRRQLLLLMTDCIKNHRVDHLMILDTIHHREQKLSSRT